ncbi:MAG: YbjQ family protein [Corynebacterium sp.]|uniref:YbjQ family protein n=1 Tax=unclassified Corynebacterium TaxID=2624378 RepID=UPI003F906DC0
MIVTTTNSIEGREVAEYLRVVSGETIAGINMFKDIGAGFRNLVGGRSKSYEGEVTRARETAIGEMVQRASELGAHAIIGVDLDYENLGQGGMMMVCASGTAVTLR